MIKYDVKDFSEYEIRNVIDNINRFEHYFYLSIPQVGFIGVIPINGKDNKFEEMFCAIYKQLFKEEVIIADGKISKLSKIKENKKVGKGENKNDGTKANKATSKEKKPRVSKSTRKVSKK